MDAFFATLDEDSNHDSPEIDSDEAASELELLGAAPASPDGANDDDVEQAFQRSFGPHEVWQREEEDTTEQDALEKVARLRAADEAASGFAGDAGGTVQRCPKKQPNHALEVELFDSNGPFCAGVVELRREGDSGILSKRPDGQGKVRFEGLSDVDTHQLRVLGVRVWAVEETLSLADELATSPYDAVWKQPSEADDADYALQQGECLWTLANRLGVEQDALWESNPDLHAEERSVNVLAPGDVVTLSDLEPELVEASVRTKVRIECAPAEARAKLCFQDDQGVGRAGLDFILRIITEDETEHVITGATDGDGGFDKAVPADSVGMEVTLATQPDPEVYFFRFAHLDPLETVGGVQGRLLKLGFWCGEERGEIGPLTRRALREFQLRFGLSESGAIDSATREKLLALHGC